jgi:hypothetical protein
VGTGNPAFADRVARSMGWHSAITAKPENELLTCNTSEPPIGIEPMTYALRVACCLPPHALPAPIARIIAPTAPTTLELSGTPFHEPFHGAAPQIQKGDLNRSDHRSSGL